MDDAASTLSDAAAQIDFSLLSGANATFIAEMNRAWRANSKSVDQNWNAYFKAFGDLAQAGDDIEAGPSWGREQSRVIGAVDPDASNTSTCARSRLWTCDCYPGATGGRA